MRVAAFIALSLIALPARAEPLAAVNFGIQIGAFKEFERAENTQEALEDAGYNSYFSEAEGYKRVRVGPFTSRAEAEKEAAALWPFLVARFGPQEFARPWVVVEDRPVENAPLPKSEETERLTEAATQWPTDRLAGERLAAERHEPMRLPEVAGDSAAAIIADAMSHLGIPYHWGGSTADGFDCSGFIQYLFARAGLEIPRQAKNQIRVGEEVAVEDLQPGDLVFFRTYARYASHVGIYIGEGDFLHASSGEGEVTITPLFKRYYANRYLGARRVLKMDPDALAEMTRLVNR